MRNYKFITSIIYYRMFKFKINRVMTDDLTNMDINYGQAFLVVKNMNICKIIQFSNILWAVGALNQLNMQEWGSIYKPMSHGQ